MILSLSSVSVSLVLSLSSHSILSPMTPLTHRPRLPPAQRPHPGDAPPRHRHRLQPDPAQVPDRRCSPFVTLHVLLYAPPDNRRAIRVFTTLTYAFHVRASRVATIVESEGREASGPLSPVLFWRFTGVGLVRTPPLPASFSRSRSRRDGGRAGRGRAL